MRSTKDASIADASKTPTYDTTVSVRWRALAALGILLLPPSKPSSSTVRASCHISLVAALAPFALAAQSPTRNGARRREPESPPPRRQIKAEPESTMRSVAVCFALVLASACYRYTPTSNATPSLGDIVRLDLTTAGMGRMSSILGRDAVAVEGSIVAVDDTSYVMSVSGTRQREDQSRLSWAGERVVIPRSAVQSIERRSLDKKKTWLVAGLVVLGAIAAKVIVSGIDALAGGDDGGIIPPPPP
jgi:hypothetical protein